MAKKSRVLPAKHGDELHAALEKSGWHRAETPTPFVEANVQSVWKHDAADAYVAWVDDQEISEHLYGLVFGPGFEAGLASLRATGWMIEGKAGIATIQHATNVNELGSAARALGLLAVGPFDADVHKVLAGLLNSKSTDLQFDALTGIAMSAWPQFEPALDALIAAPDTDPKVREDAEAIKQEQAESDWNAEFR